MSKVVKSELSDEAKRILKYLEIYIQQNSFPPSRKEIAEGTNLSRFVVNRAICELEDHREVKHVKNKPRTLTVVGMKFMRG